MQTRRAGRTERSLIGDLHEDAIALRVRAVLAVEFAVDRLLN